MLAALAGPTPMWYATRASGYTALVLLSASVVLGVLTSSRESRRDWPRFVVQSLHRNLSLLVGVFLVIHILTSVIDPFAKLTFVDAFVPFIATYRPLWLGLGVVGFELLIAITATSLMRHRLGWRSWRFVHLFAYASWPVAVIHGLGTGTDTKSLWALAAGRGVRARGHRRARVAPRACRTAVHRAPRSWESPRAWCGDRSAGRLDGCGAAAARLGQGRRHAGGSPGRRPGHAGRHADAGHSTHRRSERSAHRQPGPVGHERHRHAHG